MAIETDIHPAPPGEHFVRRERAEIIGKSVNPAVARILASVEDKKYLDPNRTVRDSKEAHLLLGKLYGKKTEDIDYHAVEALSIDSRKDFWEKRVKEEGGPSNFDEQNKLWNESFSNWIEEQVEEQNPNREEVVTTLGSVGIDIHDDKESLSNKVEGFRLKYFDGESNIKKFVSDIAKDCRTGDAIWENSDHNAPIDIEGSPERDKTGREYVHTKDGNMVPLDEVVFPVDLEKLQKRLGNVKGLLSSFGNTDGIPELVEDFASAHGLLSQKTEDRTQTLEALKPHIASKIPEGPEKDRLRALYNKEQQLAKKAGNLQTVFNNPGNPQQPPEQTQPGNPVQPENPDETVEVEQQAETPELHPLVADAGGESRPNGFVNEDAIFVDKEHGSFGVFDGVGSNKFSHEASELAKETIKDVLSKVQNALTLEETEKKVKEAILEANRKIDEMNRAKLIVELEEYEQEIGRTLTEDDLAYVYANAPGLTTCVVTKLWQGRSGEKKVIIGKVGDSRAYHMHNGKLERIGLDDNGLLDLFPPEEATRIQDVLDNIRPREERNKTTTMLNTSNPAQAERLKYIFPDRIFAPDEEVEVGVGYFDFAAGIDQSLGLIYYNAPDIPVEPEPRMHVLDVVSGDKIVLATDGVLEKLLTPDIEDIVNRYPRAEEAAKELVEKNKRNDGVLAGTLGDDTTAVVIEIK